MDNNVVNGRPENVRVLLVDLSRRFGGASVRALTLARHLAPWDVAIAGLKDSMVVKIAKERNLPVRVVGSSRMDPMISFRLRSIIRNEEFQVVDTQNIQSKFWSSLTARLTDVAFVSTLNSSYRDENAGSWKGWAYSTIDWCTNSRIDRFIAVSRSIANGLIRAGVSADMVDLVTNAVDVNESSTSVDRKAIRHRIGIPEDALLCVSVGRLVWAKGYDDLIEAFVSVVDRVPNAHSVILGGGDLFELLSEKIRQNGLTDRVHLLGHCEHEMVLDVLKAGDIFVMPSRSEGVPYALLEAAALGLPILATRCGGIPEVLAEDVDAFLVSVGDLSAISSGLVRLATDKKVSCEIGSNARSKIKREFSLPSQIQGARSAYIKALAHKQGIK